MTAEPEWSVETEQELRRGGWFPGRAVDTGEWERRLAESDELVMPESARVFLAEFGGVRVERGGPGQNIGRVPFRLDPLAAEWDGEIIEALAEIAGVELYPIGQSLDRHSYLAMDPAGQVWAGMDIVWLVATNARRALNNLIQGIAEHPITG